MRIAYLCCDFGVPVGGEKGAAVHVRELCRALGSLGHEILLLTPRADGAGSADAGVCVRELPLEPVEELAYHLLRSDANAGPAVARELRATLYAAVLRRRALSTLSQFGPDLVYERYSLFGTAGAALARKLGVPFFLEVNAPLSEEQSRHRGLVFAATAEELERIILCSADRVVVVSPELERWVVERGVERARVTILPNAVDVERFERAEAAGPVVRKRLGLDGRPTVGFVGTLKPWHGTEALVRAVALLHRRATGPHLVLVGDGPERQALEELAAREGIASATTFMGSVPNECIPAYLAAVDVAAAPYPALDRFYFSPLKLYEYLAAARPVVAADVGQIAHCVRPGETGRLHAPGDVDGLAHALTSVLEDPQAAVRLGRAGREHVRAHHTWEGNARAVAELARAELSRARAA